MEGRRMIHETCTKHPAERTRAFCDVCCEPYCSDCLVWAHGDARPPYCLDCAAAKAGLRARKAKPNRHQRKLAKHLQRQLDERGTLGPIGPGGASQAQPAAVDGFGIEGLAPLDLGR